jgi:thiol-disulfide isomerase/thioredoxin
VSKNSTNAELIVQLRELEVINYQKHLNELVDFVEKNMGTSIGVCYSSIRWNGETNLPFLKTLTSNFEKAHPNQQIAKKVRDRLNLIEKTSIGSILPDIAIPNIAGDTITLYNSLKQYTLVDFWASWCPPCRTESTLLNTLYKKYNNLGFEIYGVSFDFKREAWLNALEKDSRIWPNVSSVSGFNTPISEELGITALPTNLVVDANGKIIAANIHGKELEKFINNLFNN